MLLNKSDTVKRKKQNKCKISVPLLLNSREVYTDMLVGSSSMKANSTCESKTIRKNSKPTTQEYFLKDRKTLKSIEAFLNFNLLT